MLVSVFRLRRLSDSHLKIAAKKIFYQNVGGGLCFCFFFPQTVTHASPFLVQTTGAAKTESALTRASAFLATKASTVKSVNKWKMSTNAMLGAISSPPRSSSVCLQLFRSCARMKTVVANTFATWFEVIFSARVPTDTSWHRTRGPATPTVREAEAARLARQK